MEVGTIRLVTTFHLYLVVPSTTSVSMTFLITPKVPVSMPTSNHYDPYLTHKLEGIYKKIHHGYKQKQNLFKDIKIKCRNLNYVFLILNISG